MLANALQIPRLGSPRDCPRTFRVTGNDDGMLARCALALMDAGVITDAPLPRPGRGASDLLQRGLQRWFDQQTRGLRYLHFELNVNEFETSAGAHRLCVELVNHREFTFGNQVLIGPRVTALEKAHPGVGQAVLLGLHAVSRRVPLYTPMVAQDWASFSYWMGCDDEREVLTQLREQGDDPKLYEGLRAREFYAAIPRWVAHPKKPAGTRTIERLATRNDRAGRVVRILAELSALQRGPDWPEPQPNPDDVTMFCHAAILRWHRDDPMPRILDDFGHELAESGEYIEHFSRALFSDPRLGTIAGSDDVAPQYDGPDAAFKDYFDNLARLFTMLRLADRLIHEIHGAKP